MNSSHGQVSIRTSDISHARCSWVGKWTGRAIIILLKKTSSPLFCGLPFARSFRELLQNGELSPSDPRKGCFRPILKGPRLNYHIRTTRAPEEVARTLRGNSAAVFSRNAAKANIWKPLESFSMLAIFNMAFGGNIHPCKFASVALSVATEMLEIEAQFQIISFYSICLLVVCGRW